MDIQTLVPRAVHSLLQLPQNIWRDNVVYFLPKMEDLVRLDSAVTNKFERLTFHANISGCKRFTVYNAKTNSGQIKWFSFHEMIAPVVRFSDDPSPEDEPYIQKVLQHARCIHFTNNAFSQDGKLLDWSCSEKLVQLNIRNSEVKDISPIAACCSLKLLSLAGCPHVTDETFALGIAGCVKLSRCNLHNCILLSGTAVCALLDSCEELKDVNLSGLFNIFQIFNRSGSFPSIKVFDCSDCYGCFRLTGAAIRTITSALTNLTTLALRYSVNTVMDGDIEALGQGCKFLTSISLYSLAQVTDGGVIALARAATQLLSLSLQRMMITDAAIQAVGTHCRSLERLDVTECCLLTDRAFLTLNVRCLESLSITGTQVTGTFAAHIFSKESALNSFYCFVGAQLNARFVENLPRFSKLSYLCLGTNLLSEADWMELSMKFPNLWDLCIRNAPAVSDAVALSFQAHCKPLYNVDLEGCNVSPEVMQQLNA